MFSIKLIFGVTAAIVGIFQYLPYIRDVLKGTTKPHAFSWFVWGLPAGIVYLAQLVQGGGAGSWATGITAFLCTVIFIFSLFLGEKDIKRVDVICLTFSLIAIALWVGVKDPLWTVILVTIADFVAIGPTIRKSLTKPTEETMSTYILGSLKWILSLIALSVYSPATVIYPAAMVVNNALFVGIILPIRMRHQRADLKQ